VVIAERTERILTTPLRYSSPAHEVGFRSGAMDSMLGLSPLKSVVGALAGKSELRSTATTFVPASTA
jgi:hypothetical protein